MISYATILAAVIALYVIVRAVFPLKSHWANKLALCLIVLLATFKFHVFYLIEGRNFFTPSLPAELVWSGCWLFCAAFAFALLLIAVDVVRLPLHLLLRITGHKPRRRRWRRLNNRVNLVLLLAALGVTAWGTWCGIKAPEVRTIEVPVVSLSAGAAPIRIVQLSDLHADSTKGVDFYRDIVQKTNALQPDVVVITGDFADGTVQNCGAALAPLRELDSPMGVYAVTGNHDFFWGYTMWQGYLKALGVEFIDNRFVNLLVDIETEDGGVTKELNLIGLADPMSRRNGIEQTELSQLVPPAGQNQVPTILLAHQPRMAEESATHPIDLQLSGHTHGGQFPGLQELVAHMNNGYVHGLYRVGNMQLYVSAGTSLWTPICLRLGIPAEITLINLVPAEK